MTHALQEEPKTATVVCGQHPKKNVNELNEFTDFSFRKVPRIRQHSHFAQFMLCVNTTFRFIEDA